VGSSVDKGRSPLVIVIVVAVVVIDVIDGIDGGQDVALEAPNCCPVADGLIRIDAEFFEDLPQQVSVFHVGHWISFRLEVKIRARIEPRSISRCLRPHQGCHKQGSACGRSRKRYRQN
jgi:hypothetical protein